MSGKSPANKLLQLSVADAAYRTTFVERAVFHRPTPAIHIGRELAQHPSGASFLRQDTTSTIRSFRLGDIVLDSDTMALVKDDHILSQTLYLTPSDTSSKLQIVHNSLATVTTQGPVVIGCNAPYQAYQHWMTQCLPAIDHAFRQSAGEGHILATLPLAAWQRETLALLGYGAAPRFELKRGIQYFLRDVVYSEYLCGRASFGLSSKIKETADRLSLATPRHSRKHPIVYVPCTNPYYGVALNEDRLVELLREHNVYILDRAALSLADRIALFREAEVVIGPHGEGLTDILFCQPGTLVWEIMPRRFQNASYNRLAQGSDLDYWGDICQAGEPNGKGDWVIDLEIIERNIGFIGRRRSVSVQSVTADLVTTVPAVSIDDISIEELLLEDERPLMLSPPAAEARDPIPIEDLLLQFESLGDNCEFGLVQRRAGVEPLGLFRFAGIFLPPERRLPVLVAALEDDLSELGNRNTLAVEVVGRAGFQEYMVRESSYNVRYHSFTRADSISAEDFIAREYRRLKFLRNKFIGDLAVGEKILVWRSRVTNSPNEIQPLLDCLRRRGPNILLWVVEADPDHCPGTVDHLEADLLKGYVERFAPDADATQIRPRSWFQVCERAYDLVRRGRSIAQDGRIPSLPAPIAEWLKQYPTALS